MLCSCVRTSRISATNDHAGVVNSLSYSMGLIHSADQARWARRNMMYFSPGVWFAGSKGPECGHPVRLPGLVAFALSRTFSSPRTIPFYKLYLNKHLSPKLKLLCLCSSMPLMMINYYILLVGGPGGQLSVKCVSRAH